MARWIARQFFRSVGILAAYALVLQALLAAALPLALAAESDPTAICLSGHGDAAALAQKQVPQDQGRLQIQHPCCLSCALPVGAPPPVAAGTADTAARSVMIAYRSFDSALTRRSVRSPRLPQGPPRLT
jgi:hypothetical protein